MYHCRIRIILSLKRFLYNLVLQIKFYWLTIIRGFLLRIATDKSHINMKSKKLSLWKNKKIKFSYHYTFATWWREPIIFQTYIISNLKYLRSTTLGCTDRGIGKLEFVQQLIIRLYLYHFIRELNKDCKSNFKWTSISGSLSDCPWRSSAGVALIFGRR